MAKKVMLVILTVIAAGGAFAQAKNTIVVDIGPTIVGGIFGMIGNMAGEEGLSSSGFGIAAQYERQILKQFSAAGRFAYLRGGVGITDKVYESGIELNSKLGTKLSSFSIEGHARYYPFGDTFFLDGMLGYANMSADFSGTMIGTDIYTGHKETVSAGVSASRNFLKLGAKVGWRISFGKNGGFTFEPSLGYSAGIGFGDTIGKQLAKQIKEKTGSDVDVSEFDENFSLIEKFVFIGGPRVTLAFGWRF